MYIQWCWILIFVSIMTVASITFNPICVLVPGDLPTWRVLTFLRYFWCFLSRGHYTSELFPMLEFMRHSYQCTVRNSFKCDLNRDKPKVAVYAKCVLWASCNWIFHIITELNISNDKQQSECEKLELIWVIPNNSRTFFMWRLHLLDFNVHSLFLLI